MQRGARHLALTRHLTRTDSLLCQDRHNWPTPDGDSQAFVASKPLYGHPRSTVHLAVPARGVQVD